MIKKLTLIVLLITLTTCGYSPLLNSDKTNFYIGDLKFEGDRQINNYILTSLKKYQIFQQNSQRYDIKIISKYDKTIINKDRSGNPKNYNLKAQTEIKIIKDNIEQVSSFEKNISLSAQNKRIREKVLEKKYKKNLSDLLIKDIIYFLNNQ